MTERKDVLLVGLGAVGAIYSFILTRSGLATVTCVARSNHDIINERGLEIRSKKFGTITGWRPHRLCRSVSEAADREYSYVLLTTKSLPERIKTSEVLAPLLDQAYVEKYTQPAYVIMQNGLNVEEELYGALIRAGVRQPKIIGTAVWIDCNLFEGNIVEHNHLDRLAAGVYRHNDNATTINTPEESALLSDYCAIIEAGGSTATAVAEIQRVKFKKNLWNAAFGSYATLTGYPLPAIFRSPPQENRPKYSPYVSPTTASLVTSETLSSIRAVLQELLQLGRAMGYSESDLPPSVIEETITNTRRFHQAPESVHHPSMLLDYLHGRPMEVEHVLGEVVRMARKHNVETPRVETLYGLLIVIQNQIFRKMEEDSSKTQRLGL